MADSNEIVVKLEHVINSSGGQGLPSSGVPSGPSAGASLPSLQGGTNKSIFYGSISAQMAVSMGGRLVGLLVDQETGKTIRDVGEYGFLIARAAAGDITAMSSLVVKGLTDVLQKYKEYQAEQRAIAQVYNDITVMQLRSGQISITANTITSYDKWGRLTLKEKK